jgi:hypothetical protein
MRQIPPAVPADQGQIVHEAVDALYRGWQADRSGTPPGELANEYQPNASPQRFRRDSPMLPLRRIHPSSIGATVL